MMFDLHVYLNALGVTVAGCRWDGRCDMFPTRRLGSGGNTQSQHRQPSWINEWAPRQTRSANTQLYTAVVLRNDDKQNLKHELNR